MTSFEEKSEYFEDQKDRLADIAAERDRLKAALRSSNDLLTDILLNGMPKKGRSNDAKDAIMGWWDDAIYVSQYAYATLAGVDHIEWRTIHPGLFMPPAGDVVLAEFASMSGSSSESDAEFAEDLQKFS